MKAGLHKAKGGTAGAHMPHTVARLPDASGHKMQATHTCVEQRPVQAPRVASVHLQSPDYELFPQLPSLQEKHSFPQTSDVQPSIQPEQVLDTFTAARDMAESVRQTCMSLDSASRVVSSRIQALDSILEWADDLAHFSVTQQMRLVHARDASFGAGMGVIGGSGTAAFRQHTGNAGLVNFSRVQETMSAQQPVQLQQAAATACIEAATACIEAVRPLEVATADTAVSAALNFAAADFVEDTAQTLEVEQSSPNSLGANTVHHVSPEAPPSIEPTCIDDAPHIEPPPRIEHPSRVDEAAMDAKASNVEILHPVSPLTFPSIEPTHIEDAPHIESPPRFDEAAIDAKASNIKILHPGIEGSSSIHVECSEERQTAVITVRAEVHVTPCTSGVGEECVPMPANHASMDVAAAFASSIAAQAAVSCSKELLDFASPVVNGTATSKGHEQILNTLQHGNIVRVHERMFSQFSHEAFIVDMEHAETGHKCKAMVKPREQGDFDGWHRTPVERAAYLLNLLLGMDYVPPTVYRQHLVINGRHYPDGGAVIYFVDRLKLLEEVPEDDWGIGKRSLLSDTRVLDILLHNTDRHIGHFAWGQHWSAAKCLPVLIDHAAGFRDGASVCMQQDNAFQTGMVTQVNSQTYLHLKLLDAAVIAKRLHGILSAGEIIAIIERRDGILRYLNELVLEDGIENVLL